MAKNKIIDPDEYRKSVKLVLGAIAHHSLKARTAKESADQVAHAQACNSLANAFVLLYKPGLAE